MIDKIETLTEGFETPSTFAKKATRERIKRMMARDSRAREQQFENDIERFTPVVEAILNRLGK